MIRLVFSIILGTSIAMMILQLVMVLATTPKNYYPPYPIPIAELASSINESATSHPIEVDRLGKFNCADSVINTARKRLEGFRSCNAATDCQSVGLEQFNTIAVNKSQRQYVDNVIYNLNKACGVDTLAATNQNDVQFECSNERSAYKRCLVKSY